MYEAIANWNGFPYRAIFESFSALCEFIEDCKADEDMELESTHARTPEQIMQDDSLEWAYRIEVVAAHLMPKESRKYDHWCDLERLLIDRFPRLMIFSRR